MLCPRRSRLAPTNARDPRGQQGRRQLIAILGLTPLTWFPIAVCSLILDPVETQAQQPRINHFAVPNSAAATQNLATRAESRRDTATAQLMTPMASVSVAPETRDSDDQATNQPSPHHFVTEPAGFPADAIAPPAFSFDKPTQPADHLPAPVGPNASNFEAFQPPAFSAPSRETKVDHVPHIAMRPDARMIPLSERADEPLSQHGPPSQSPPSPKNAPSSRMDTASTPRPKRLPAAAPEQSEKHSQQVLETIQQERRRSIALSERRRAEQAKARVAPPEATSGMYLATQTATSKLSAAWTHFQRAEVEYSTGAYASAEASAWQTLQLAAEAIDLHEHHTRSRAAINTDHELPPSRATSAVQQLHSGRDALTEAQDFVGPYATEDPQSIARLARSHRTAVVRQGLPRKKATSFNASVPSAAPAKDRLSLYADMSLEQTESMVASVPTSTEAIDRYLDLARMELSDVASRSLLAAQAMDLLAAIRLGRNEATQLPGPSAICLRRAAVQGQSNHPDLVAKLGFHLAEVGLIEEATWALRHSLSLRHDPAVLNKLNQLESRSPNASTVLKSMPMANHTPTRRTPDVIAMQPEQFANISRSVIPAPSATTQNASATAAATARTTMVSGSTSRQATPATYRMPARGETDVTAESTPADTTESRSPRMGSRFLPQLKKWW
ncbi:hypothetical protein LOC71_07590 [Rhodopirellula sp. JC740]|uniref:Transmembrane protein n=1 Tax=Rhodopirellula halodulae TaxID=2894198 RepID=A0ABS8NF10_9BACT|nr:hypothetical protein [Rhodopirellula sp. JC740]MCC9642132.1 hypothetical protein [Rhodopirellula sp. JC740]